MSHAIREYTAITLSSSRLQLPLRTLVYAVSVFPTRSTHCQSGSTLRDDGVHVRSAFPPKL